MPLPMALGKSGSFSRCWEAFSCLLLHVGLLTSVASAATPTSTTLVVTPSNTIGAQQIATLTASVQSGSQPITVGTVSFYDGKLYLTSVQVVRDPSHGSAAGTATLKKAFSSGTHSIVATFQPTSTLAASSSAAQTITVGAAPANGSGTTALLLEASSQSMGGAVSFTATLSTNGGVKPTGSILFSNQTSNLALGTVALDPSSFQTGYTVLDSFAAPEPGNAYAADLNGDGLPDLLIVQNPDDRGTGLQPYLNSINGSFQAGEVLAGAGTIGAPAFADFNGDGVPDFALSYDQENIQFEGLGPNDDTMMTFLGAGDGTFPLSAALIPASDTGLSLGFVATGDFNGDGIPDITVTDITSANSPMLYVFAGKGDGTFNAPITSPGVAGLTSLVAQDFNRDGIADLAVTTSKQNSVQILLGKGDGTFLPSVSYSAGNMPVIATTLQARGNGMSDLGVWNQGDNSFTVMLGSADGAFVPQTAFSISSSQQTPVQIAAADFTGDGLQDIAVLYAPAPTGSTLGIYPGNGDGTYGAAIQKSLSDFAGFTMAVADFNQDGSSELAFPVGSEYLVNIFANGIYETVPLTATVYGKTADQQLVEAIYSGDSNYSSSTSNPEVFASAGPPPPSIAVSANPSMLTVAAGKTVTTTLTVTPQGGFNGTVQFSCNGLPANASCTFAPASATANGAAVTSTLTLSTNVTAATLNRLNFWRNAATSLATLLGFFSLVGLRSSDTRLKAISGPPSPCFVVAIFSFVLGASLFVGCGGGSSSTKTSPPPISPVTPAGTSSVTVTAAQPGASGLSAQVVLTVTVTN